MFFIVMHMFHLQACQTESNSTDPYETATQREGAGGGVSGQTDAVGGKEVNN